MLTNPSCQLLRLLAWGFFCPPGCSAHWACLGVEASTCAPPPTPLWGGALIQCWRGWHIHTTPLPGELPVRHGSPRAHSSQWVWASVAHSDNWLIISLYLMPLLPYLTSPNPLPGITSQTTICTEILLLLINLWHLPFVLRMNSKPIQLAHRDGSCYFSSLTASSLGFLVPLHSS